MDSKRVLGSIPHLCAAMFLATTTVVGAIGCGVTKTTHQDVKDQLQRCESERDALAAKHSKLANELEDQSHKLGKQLEAKESELSASKEELEELRKRRAAMDKQLAEFQKLTESFQEMVAADGIQVYVRRGRMIVALPSGVLFPSGKAELSPRGLQTLERVATKLDEFKDRRFIVAGHTDNVPIRKVTDFQDNWELSAGRAIRVTRYLIEKGMNPKNLAAAGYGQYDPVKSNKGPGGRRQNRRIELILEPRVPDFTKLTEMAPPSE